MPFRDMNSRPFKTNMAQIQVSFSRLKVEMIDRFRAHVADQHASEIRRLKRLAAKTTWEEHREALADQASELDDILLLADELAIIALYRVVEHTTQRAWRWRYGRKARLPGWDGMKRKLKRDVNLDVEALPHYGAIDELRLLNNAIKHEGRVTGELANYPGWKTGGKLTRRKLAKAYGRFSRRGRLAQYLTALAGAVIPAKDLHT